MLVPFLPSIFNGLAAGGVKLGSESAGGGMAIAGAGAGDGTGAITGGALGSAGAAAGASGSAGGGASSANTLGTLKTNPNRTATRLRNSTIILGPPSEIINVRAAFGDAQAPR